VQNNQNLWIGLLIGAGLTGLLMYVLSQYSESSDTTAPTAVKTQPSETPFAQSKPPEAKKVTAQAINNQPKPAKVETPPQQAPAQPVEKHQPSPATPPIEKPQNTDLPKLPKDPSLSEADLAKLSPEEKKRYEKVLETYQQVHDQVLELNKERSQLQRHMNEIINENTTIDQQLDQMRQGQDNN